MQDIYFTEEDKIKLIEFMNIVAKTATFELKTEELITYFKLLAHMQQKIIPKMEANIFEVVRSVKAASTEEPKAKGKK